MTATDRSVGYDTLLDCLFHYGYVPNCSNAGLPAAVEDATSAANPKGDLESGGQRLVDALRSAIADELTHIPDDVTHVVPLSAGLDSRAILAVLLEAVEVDPSKVRTITFGTPGTWDFELGQRVATTANVPNETIDLSGDSFDWSVTAMEEYASTRACPGSIITGYVNGCVARSTPDDSLIWVGYMGDPTAGGHQPRTKRTDWNSARSYFARNECAVEGLSRPGFEPRSILPAEPYLSKRRLSYEEQLDFAHRQQCAIAPSVIADGSYRFPYVNPRWLAVSLNLPAPLRRGRRAFVDGFASAFPDLFSIPTDSTAGLPVRASRLRQKARRARLAIRHRLASARGHSAIHPATNYLDFESAFRSGVLHEPAGQLIADLANRECIDWFDPVAVWNAHLDGRDRSHALLVCCDAELSLSAVVANGRHIRDGLPFQEPTEL